MTWRSEREREERRGGRGRGRSLSLDTQRHIFDVRQTEHMVAFTAVLRFFRSVAWRDVVWRHHYEPKRLFCVVSAAPFASLLRAL